ncbi:MAG: helix-turn-helix domain-containing protein [Opitutaceae bacterium]|nr:helix-turn-helix domain-containing protein [Opitutaceae bacterium]
MDKPKHKPGYKPKHAPKYKSWRTSARLVFLPYNMPHMNPDNNIPATETKRQKINRLLAQGMTPTQIAKEAGVSRYYVYIVKNNLTLPRYARPGLKNTEPRRPGPGRGNRKAVPFTDEERAAFAAVLSGPPPVPTRARKKSASPPGDLWTAKQSRAWFLRHFGRYPQRRQLADFAEEHGIIFAPEDPDDMEWDSLNFFDATFYATQAARIQARKESGGAKPRDAIATNPDEPTPEKKYRRRSARVEILTEADIAEMERANKRVQEEMARNAVAIAAKSHAQPIRSPGVKLGRNDPCPHNPGIKFKRCCGADGDHFCTRDAQ